MLSRTTAEADEGHLDTLVAVIDTVFRPQNATVVFTTTAGTFTNGSATITVAPDSDGVARAFIKAPKDSSIAIVTATAGGKLETRRLAYVPAYPAWTTLSADPPVVKATPGASSTVTATLSRALGNVSPGGVLVLKADGQPAVSLSADSIPTSARESVKVVLLGTDTGIVMITASYSRNHHTTATATTAIHFIPQ